MTRFICNAHAIMPDMKGYEDIVSGYSGRFNTTAAKGRISVMRGERNGIFDFYEKVESEAGKILYIHNKDSEGEIFYEAEREDGNGEKFKDVVLRIPYQKGKVRGYFKSFTDSNGTHYEIEFNARGQLIVSKSTYKDVKGVPTIGYGCTDPELVKKGKLTETEAQEALKKEV